MRAVLLVHILATVASLSSCSDSTSLSEFGRELAQAQACSLGDACALFQPQKECLCELAVNARELDRITSLSATVDCDGAMSSCPAPPKNPQCVDGVCKDAVAVLPLDAGLSDATGD